jgi:hypothetical protein
MAKNQSVMLMGYDCVARASLPVLIGAITSGNNIYKLRSLRCRGSSRARPRAPGPPPRAALEVHFALVGRCPRHIKWASWLYRYKVERSVTLRLVNPTLSDIVADYSPEYAV